MQLFIREIFDKLTEVALALPPYRHCEALLLPGSQAKGPQAGRINHPKMAPRRTVSTGFSHQVRLNEASGHKSYVEIGVISVQGATVWAHHISLI